jgi:Rho GTPase-activating protein RGD1
MGQINDGKDFRDYVLDFTSKVPPANRYSNPQPPSTLESSGYGRSQAPQLPEPAGSGDFNQDFQRTAAPSNGQYLPPMNFQTSQDRFTPSPAHQPSYTGPISAQPPQLAYPSISSTNLSTPYLSDSVQPTPASAFAPPAFAPTPPPDKGTPTQSYTLPQQRPYDPPSKPSTPKGRTFGVPLDIIITRENATLPLIVAQCIIAIDQFGLNAEGIYRKSGSASNLAKLRRLFDFEPESVDFRTEAGFYGDIHAVAGILKQFLRDLPEPLLTQGFYAEFIRVSSVEHDYQRRDAVHSLVNDLPDANYSCIRSLSLHLHKCFSFSIG